MKRKNAAAVALGRKGGLKGGPARAALLTPEQRSQSAKKAVTTRWAKAKAAKKDTISANRKTIDQKRVKKAAPAKIDTSDNALVNLLNRLRVTVEPAEIRELSDQIERVVFHKQFMNA
jgi:hypothetical protein